MARINHRFANVDRGMHHSIGWSQVRGAAGVDSAAAEIEDGRSDAIVWIDDVSSEDVFRVTTDGADITWTVGSAGAPVDYDIVIASAGVSFSVQDEDAGQYVRVNPSVATGRWLRFGPGADPNEEITYYFEGDRAGIVLPRVTTANRNLITAVEDGMIVYNTDDDELNLYAGGSWTSVGSGGATDLDSLTDVVITAPAAGEILEYDGAEWVNTELTGTISTSFEVNSDATDGVLEFPNIVLSGGDGGTDLVQTNLILDTTNEILYIGMLRDLNGIPMTFGVGNLTTDNQGSEIRFQGGNGTNRSRYRVGFGPSADVITVGLEEDNAGGGVWTQQSMIWWFGRSTGATATTSRSTTVNFYAGDGSTERVHSMAVGTGGGMTWTIPAIANALQITDGTNVYIDIDATGTETLNLGNSTARVWVAIEDNRTDAFDVFQSSNEYIVVNTNNGTEEIVFGNIVTDPDHVFMGTGEIRQERDNGQAAHFDAVTESVTLNSGGATQASAITVPEDAIVLGVSVRVTTALTGPTSFGFDINGLTVATGIATALNTTRVAMFSGDHDGNNNANLKTIDVVAGGAGPATVNFTAVGGNFTTGVVRLTIHYIQVTAPTS